MTVVNVENDVELNITSILDNSYDHMLIWESKSIHIPTCINIYVYLYIFSFLVPKYKYLWWKGIEPINASLLHVMLYLIYQI